MRLAAATAVSGAALVAFASGALALSEVEEESVQVALEAVAEGLAAPVDLTAGPDGRLYIVEQVGRVRIVDNGELLDEPFLDVSDRIVDQLEEFDERGLLAIAFHPDYADNGRFFVYYSAPIRADAPFGRRARWDHTAYLSEFRVSDDPNQADPGSERRILEVDQPAFNHNGAQILFGPDDGYLYIGLGDGGAAHDLAPDSPRHGYGQHRDTLLGKILRIDVDNDDDEPYAVPQDNPFVDDEDWRPEIYALGFRNPWRMSFDGEGRLLVADVGQWAYEWVNVVESGGNYGWRIKEGSHCFDPFAPTEHPDECSDEMWGIPLTDPVVEYMNRGVFPDQGLGVAIMGGHLYEGSDVPDLAGMYVYADWSRTFWEADGVLMAARSNDDGFWPIRFLEVTNMDEPLPYILSIGRDADGELYVLTSPSTGPREADGTVYRIAPAS